MLKSLLRPLGLAALAAPALLLAPASVKAGVVVSIEAPGVQSSQRGGVVTETFDRQALPPGLYPSIPSAIGEYTTTSTLGAAISGPDAYGGAYQTNYLTVGQYGGGAQEVTLSLTNPASYFGFYFAAIDASNSVSIYDGLTLVTTITGSSLAPLINGDPAYYGNPNLPGVNTGEAYAYVNVDGLNGQTFDRIVFSNFSSSGLESDNHSVNAVPEPSSIAMAAIGGAALLGLGMRRRPAR
jgi:hypothetical protein